MGYYIRSYMSPEEQAQKIKEIYDEAIAKLEKLGVERQAFLKERDTIISSYIHDLETQKIAAIRASLGATN
jgi:translation elongation factor EF-Ts